MSNKNSSGGVVSSSTITTNPLSSTISMPSYTFPNSSGSISTGQMYYNTTTSSYNTDYDFESKVIDIEKLSKFDETKRKLIFDLIIAFINCSDYNSKKLMLNTLNSYGVIGDKKSLDRKIKIANITNEKD